MTTKYHLYMDESGNFEKLWKGKNVSSPFIMAQVKLLNK